MTGREDHMCSCLFSTLYKGPGLSHGTVQYSSKQGLLRARCGTLEKHDPVGASTRVFPPAVVSFERYRYTGN